MTIAYRSEANERARADGLRIASLRCIDAWYDWYLLHLRFEGSLSLTIESSQSSIAWSVVDAHDERPLSPLTTCDTPISLEWPSEIYEWDRTAVMKTFVGSRLAKLRANDDYLFLYFDNHILLSVTMCIDARDGTQLLFWTTEALPSPL